MQVNPLDVERLESLIADRFPGATPRIERIPAGLGLRRFYRIALDPGRPSVPSSLIARVEPDPVPDALAQTPFTWIPEPPLEPIRTVLEDAGLPVPRSHAHDADLGIDLLEDVGTRTLADTSAEEQRERYVEAGELIQRVQAVHGSPDLAPAFGRYFGAELIRTKAAKLIHWSFPGLLGREAEAAERTAIETGFEAIAQLLGEVPRVLAHRDFKAENLHLVAPQPGSGSTRERLVMIDIQGAFMAPPEYDRVCLLRDLQVDLPEPLVDEVCDRALSRLPDQLSREASRRRFEAIAVVRLAKDIAHIVDAGRSRGDRRRWHEIPRGLELLESALRRLTDTFPPARELKIVMLALSQGAETSDSNPSREGNGR